MLESQRTPHHQNLFGDVGDLIDRLQPVGEHHGDVDRHLDKIGAAVLGDHPFDGILSTVLCDDFRKKSTMQHMVIGDQMSLRIDEKAASDAGNPFIHIVNDNFYDCRLDRFNQFGQLGACRSSSAEYGSHDDPRQ